MSEKLDQIERTLERLWGHLARTREDRAAEHSRGWNEGYSKGRELGYQEGLQAGYEEGKLFDTRVPDVLSVKGRP